MYSKEVIRNDFNEPIINIYNNKNFEIIEYVRTGRMEVTIKKEADKAAIIAYQNLMKGL